MKHTKKCRVCWWGMLRDRQALEVWLAAMLGAEFRYQWSVRDEMGRKKAFRIVHPLEYADWLEKGPCKGCPCESHCDEICSLRAAWWDARVERIRAGCANS